MPTPFKQTIKNGKSSQYTLKIQSLHPTLRLSARCSAPGGLYFPSGAFSLFTMILPTHNPCLMVFWYPFSKLAKYRSFHKPPPLSQVPLGPTQPTITPDLLCLWAHTAWPLAMGVLSDLLYPWAHTAYLLLWVFFWDAIVLYVGVFLLPRAIYCPLSTILLYHPLFLQLCLPRYT